MHPRRNPGRAARRPPIILQTPEPLKRRRDREDSLPASSSASSSENPPPRRNPPRNHARARGRRNKVEKPSSNSSRPESPAPPSPKRRRAGRGRRDLENSLPASPSKSSSALTTPPPNPLHTRDGLRRRQNQVEKDPSPIPSKSSFSNSAAAPNPPLKRGRTPAEPNQIESPSTKQVGAKSSVQPSPKRQRLEQGRQDIGTPSRHDATQSRHDESLSSDQSRASPQPRERIFRQTRRYYYYVGRTESTARRLSLRHINRRLLTEWQRRRPVIFDEDAISAGESKSEMADSGNDSMERHHSIDLDDPDQYMEDQKTTEAGADADSYTENAADRRFVANDSSSLGHYSDGLTDIDHGDSSELSHQPLSSPPNRPLPRVRRANPYQQSSHHSSQNSLSSDSFVFQEGDVIWGRITGAYLFGRTEQGAQPVSEDLVPLSLISQWHTRRVPRQLPSPENTTEASRSDFSFSSDSIITLSPRARVQESESPLAPTPGTASSQPSSLGAASLKVSTPESSSPQTSNQGIGSGSGSPDPLIPNFTSQDREPSSNRSDNGGSDDSGSDGSGSDNTRFSHNVFDHNGSDNDESDEEDEDLTERVFWCIQYTRASRSKNILIRNYTRFILETKLACDYLALNALRQARAEGLAHLIVSHPEYECYEIGAPYPVAQQPERDRMIGPHWWVGKSKAEVRAGPEADAARIKRVEAAMKAQKTRKRKDQATGKQATQGPRVVKLKPGWTGSDFESSSSGSSKSSKEESLEEAQAKENGGKSDREPSIEVGDCNMPRAAAVEQESTSGSGAGDEGSEGEAQIGIVDNESKVEASSDEERSEYTEESQSEEEGLALTVDITGFVDPDHSSDEDFEPEEEGLTFTQDITSFQDPDHSSDEDYKPKAGR